MERSLAVRDANVATNQREAGEPQRVASLDGLRAVAIGAVIISHAISNRIYGGNWEFQFGESFGVLGVDLFFVISGFIITTLLLREKESLGRISLLRFYGRRALRLWPALWLFIFTVILLHAEHDVALDLKGVVAPLLFISDYFTDSHSVITLHTWSLSVEEQFYLLWPIFVVRLDRAHLRRVLVLAILAAPLIRIATYLLVPAWRDEAFFQFHVRYDMLAAGCLLSLCQTAPRTQRMFFNRPFALACFCGVVALSVNAVDAGLSTRAFLFTVGYGIQATSLAVLVGVCVSNPHIGFARLLNNRWLVHVGTISYALYLWQQLFIVTPFSLFRSLPLGIIAAFACAELSWRAIEKPMRRWRAALHPPRTLNGVSAAAE